MTDFIQVAKVTEIPANGAKLIEIDDIRVALFNLEGEIYAIEDVCTHDGGPLVEGEIVNDLIPEDTSENLSSSVKERFGLTSRELQIYEMLAVGHSNKLIASELQLKEVTVKFHVSNIMAKLGVTNRTQAALVAKK